MINKYEVTIIGLIFSAVCFVCTWTFVAPAITIIPVALALELLYSNYSVTATRAFLTLFGLFIGATY